MSYITVFGQYKICNIDMVALNSSIVPLPNKVLLICTTFSNVLSQVRFDICSSTISQFSFPCLLSHSTTLYNPSLSLRMKHNFINQHLFFFQGYCIFRVLALMTNALQCMLLLLGPLIQFINAYNKYLEFSVHSFKSHCGPMISSLFQRQFFC